MRLENSYCFFWKARIANWHVCNFTMECLDGVIRKFTSSEQAYMYLKAEIFNDDLSKYAILFEKSDQEKVQELGQKVKNFRQDIWNDYREICMFKACYAKFSTNQEEKENFLKLKGFKFVEASPFDTIWGVGLSSKDDDILDEKNWRGLNLLGKCLDKVMEKLINEIFKF